MAIYREALFDLQDKLKLPRRDPLAEDENIVHYADEMSSATHFDGESDDDYEVIQSADDIQLHDSDEHAAAG